MGETGKAIKTRIKEHKKQIHYNFFQHLLTTGHKSLDFSDAKLLLNCDKGIRLNLLETYEIEKYKNNGNYKILNDQLYT